MTTTRSNAGEKGRLTVYRFENIDDEGNVIEIWFEVWHGNTKINGNFFSEDDALQFVEATLAADQNSKPISSPPRPSHGM
jgi:hypothetical protein